MSFFFATARIRTQITKNTLNLIIQPNVRPLKIGCFMALPGEVGDLKFNQG